MLTRIFGAVTGGRLNLRAAADSSATILASIPDETLLVVTTHDDTWYRSTYVRQQKSSRMFIWTWIFCSCDSVVQSHIHAYSERCF